MADTPPTDGTGGTVEFEPAGNVPARDVEFEADPSVQARIDAADAEGGAKRSTAQAIRDEASKLGGQAGEKLKGFAGEGKDKATDALSELARLLDSAAGDVDDKLGEQFGGYARSASQSVAKFADQVRAREIDDIVDDVGAFVRKSPGVAIGTAAAVGFVLARVLQAALDSGRDQA